ncbi:hypothetical protein [Streptomyces palmae]|uniref:DUF3558 domain-containing protein n=1 Tax=Streptomyces palmae TaxID=1701085 RepID=A0A4Z0G624_9ACTN|nr:hypothetical protein [Streptomyces palmae]TGA89398.1 hypothetical protein E4099_29275 [Streptomyces palmae]
MRSWPIILGARLLPVAALAAAGLALSGTGSSDAPPSGPEARSEPAGVHPATTVRFRRPPADACAALPAKTVRKLVPGAPTGGTALQSSDLNRRTGCSWHALDGYDYRWLDITFTVAPPTAPRPAAPEGRRLTGLGDAAGIRERLTTEDDQQTREAVLTVRVDNAMLTVTYNGSDFESGTAPGATAIREGALSAARAALPALR